VTRPSSLADWLAYLETLHPKAIALGLDRVRDVLSRLDAPIACPVVTVGGTNGKGSTCAMLESIYRCAGFATGLYASPHLLRYNERVRIRGAEAATTRSCKRSTRWRTRAAACRSRTSSSARSRRCGCSRRARLDVLVLEVGLGGRLDAVNAIDPDVAVVTSVDIDHVDFLGPTREDIGREKCRHLPSRAAGVLRRCEPARDARLGVPRSRSATSS
jgi:dihydrofolate synthase/folylpolyglutamate synthase